MQYLLLLLSGANGSSSTKKRCLPFSTASKQVDDDDNDARDRELAAAIAGPKEAKKSTNDLWNDIHYDLVRELEKKGTTSRYNLRHLKLWTDHIMEKNSAGVGDEPK